MIIILNKKEKYNDNEMEFMINTKLIFILLFNVKMFSSSTEYILYLVL